MIEREEWHRRRPVWSSPSRLLIPDWGLLSREEACFSIPPVCEDLPVTGELNPGLATREKEGLTAFRSDERRLTGPVSLPRGRSDRPNNRETPKADELTMAVVVRLTVRASTRRGEGSRLLSWRRTDGRVPCVPLCEPHQVVVVYVAIAVVDRGRLGGRAGVGR